MMKNKIRLTKKPVTEGHILYNSFSMKCPGKANPQRQKAHQWLPGAGGGSRD